MLTSEQIEKIILDALNTLNDEKEPDERFHVSSELKLFGVNSPVDSLSLVSLIVDVESAISMQINRPIALMDDRAMACSVSPFKSVQTLKEYIRSLVQETE